MDYKVTLKATTVKMFRAKAETMEEAENKVIEHWMQFHQDHLLDDIEVTVEELDDGME